MPLLGFPEKWFHPDQPLAQGFLVGFGGSICRCLIQIILIKGTKDMAATLAVGAVCLDWARITGGGISSVDKDCFALTPRMERQFLPLWAYIQIMPLVILEIL